MNKLEELAERLESATGPSVKLDAEIETALGHAGANAFGQIVFRKKSFSPKRYTASIDAAMSLVPPNHAFNIDNGPCHWICLGKQKPMGRADVRYPVPDYDGEGDSWLTVSAIAATPALALAAASLRARSHK